MLIFTYFAYLALFFLCANIKTFYCKLNVIVIEYGKKYNKKSFIGKDKFLHYIATCRGQLLKLFLNPYQIQTNFEIFL